MYGGSGRIRTYSGLAIGFMVRHDSPTSSLTHGAEGGIRTLKAQFLRLVCLPFASPRQVYDSNLTAYHGLPLGFSLFRGRVTGLFEFKSLLLLTILFQRASYMQLL